MIRSAALGGLFIGVLSALPFLGAANCCCCLWIVAGGALAAHLDQQQKDRSITAGEGAAVGALAGVLGAFVWLPIAAVVAVLLGPVQRAIFEGLLRNARDLPPEARQVFENLSGPGDVVAFILAFFTQLVIGPLFGAIGGVLSAAYFKREVPPAVGGTWTPPPLPPR